MILEENLLEYTLPINRVINWLQEEKKGGATHLALRVNDLHCTNDTEEEFPDLTNIQLEAV